MFRFVSEHHPRNHPCEERCMGFRWRLTLLHSHSYQVRHCVPLSDLCVLSYVTCHVRMLCVGFQIRPAQRRLRHCAVPGQPCVCPPSRFVLEFCRSVSALRLNFRLRIQLFLVAIASFHWHVVAFADTSPVSATLLSPTLIVNPRLARWRWTPPSTCSRFRFDPHCSVLDQQ